MPAFDPSTYVDVQERINRFWIEHPDGAIVTRLMSPPDDFERCRYEAQVFRHKDDQRPSAVGYAFELQDPNTKGPNRTSHEENCETSAIGRALANMGYAKNRDERPSRQEMTKVGRANSAPLENPAPAEDSVTPSTSAATRDIVDWTVFWKEAKALGYGTMAEYVEFTGDKIPATPQHALNRLKKTIRERDAALTVAS